MNNGFKYDPPYLIKLIFRDFQWNSLEKKILLTFDDGPNPNTTEMILNELDKYSIKSIFFCVGENLERYNELAKEILRRGHEIGNHTMKHTKLTTLRNNEIKETIVKVQDICQKAFNYRIKYFRPPHGRLNFKTINILKQEKLLNVMWSLLTYDYKNDLNIVKFAISKYLKEDSIIVLHDSNKSKAILKESISIIVEQTEINNYKIGKPSECLRFYSQ